MTALAWAAARRAVEGVPLLTVVSALTFVLLTLTSGDAATAIVQRRDGDVTAAAIQAERARLGLDQAPLWRYAHNVRRALAGDFGDSLQTGRPVPAK